MYTQTPQIHILLHKPMDTYSHVCIHKPHHKSHGYSDHTYNSTDGSFHSMFFFYTKHQNYTSAVQV